MRGRIGKQVCFWSLILSCGPFGYAKSPASIRQDSGWQSYLLAPLAFEASATTGSIQFLARGHRYGVGLQPQGFVLVLAPSPGAAQASEGPAIGPLRLEVAFAGSRPQPMLRPLEPSLAKVHSFRGNDPSLWRRDIQTYGRVRYSELYPGVDAVFYGNQGRLEFDFMVAPGAQPSAISFDFGKTARVAVQDNGDLSVLAGGERLVFLKPTIFQRTSGAEETVEGGYEMRPGGRVGFRIGPYDSSRELVIDPILTHSTFLGGMAVDRAHDVAAAGGNIYLTGVTLSTDFITVSPLQGENGGQQDAFLAVLDGDDMSLIFSTFLGGNRDESGAQVAVDSDGSILLAGTTTSFNFPTEMPIQPFRVGGIENFISRLSADGSELLFSTYFGGVSDDSPVALLMAEDGVFFLVGNTRSTNFPLLDPIQAAFSGVQDAFVSRFAPNGQLKFSTFLGGSQTDTVHGAFLSDDGSILLTGETRSEDFPVVGAVQGAKASLIDAFIVKLETETPATIFASYWGGSGPDRGRAILVDSFDHFYLLGDTASTDLFVLDATQTSNAGMSDLFVTRFNPTGTAAIFSTYLGGSGDELLSDGSIDSGNRVILSGSTDSIDFPVTNAIQGNNGGGRDGFVSRLDASLRVVDLSTYLGGSGSDRVNALALDAGGGLLVAGETSSGDFPVAPQAFQATLGGETDGFLARLADAFALNFAQFGNGSQSGTTLRSRIELVNPDPTQEAAVNLVIRDDAGQPLTVILNGSPLEGSGNFQIPAGGNLNLESDGQGPLAAGSVRVFSQREITGFVFFDAGAVGAAGVGASPPLTSLLAPVRTGSGANTGLALMGLGADQILTLTLRDEGGELRGQAEIQLAARGRTSLFVTEIDWSPIVDFSDFRGNVTAQGASEFAATAILVEPGRFIILPVADLGN